ncbi:MAG: hypothetical protein EB015_22000 [Methylocystaceae bacterium]|nr:hypothetical protein [Methylocystaceae bacterium]
MSESRPSHRAIKAPNASPAKEPGRAGSSAQTHQAITNQTAAQLNRANSPALIALAQLLGRQHAKAALRTGGRDE